MGRSFNSTYLREICNIKFYSKHYIRTFIKRMTFVLTNDLNDICFIESERRIFFILAKCIRQKMISNSHAKIYHNCAMK